MRMESEREGHLTLLKETRARGEDGYWYAYRRLGKRTVKKYAGRPADLTFARLEWTARELLRTPEKTKQVRHDVPTGDASGVSKQSDWQAAGQYSRAPKTRRLFFKPPCSLPSSNCPHYIPRWSREDDYWLCWIAGWSTN